MAWSLDLLSSSRDILGTGFALSWQGLLHLASHVVHALPTSIMAEVMSEVWSCQLDGLIKQREILKETIIHIAIDTFETS